MAVRIAIANHKGGVGKSTTTMMLADGLALLGYRVLVLDFDPQAMISKVLLGISGLDAVERQRRTLGHLLQQLANGKAVQLAKYRTRASDLIPLRDATDGRGVDLVASNRNLLKDLGDLEDAIRALHRKHRIDVTLATLLEPQLLRLSAHYDVMLFDCPAGTPPLALAALRLATHAIAPTNLEQNAYSALTDFLHIILEDDLGLAGKLRVHVLPTMYQAQNPEQRRMLDHIQGGIYGLNAFTRPVPMMTAIQRAEDHPGPGNYRSPREKYDQALVEVEALARAVAERIMKGNKT